MRILSIKDAIRGKLPEGGSCRILCPVCNGGSSKEKSMTVYHSDRGITYHCFRNKCKTTGTLTGPVTFGGKVNESKSYKLQLSALPDGYDDVLPVKSANLRPLWETRLQMVMYPVLGYYGVELGYVQRHYKELNSWWKGSKALNILHDTTSSTPFIHFPVLTSANLSDTLTLVEDWPSAEAVAQYEPCVALLGTSLSPTDVSYLRSIGITKIRVCLDNDALSTAARMKRQLSLLFSDVTVVFVDKDPKDMSPKELTDKFGKEEL